MAFFGKLLASIAIIIVCTRIGSRFPSLAGLIATMPLTGLIVLLWLYVDNGGDRDVMVGYTRGAVWGILPTILFFAVAFFCFRRELPLAFVLCVSFAVWFLGALVHQLLVR